MPMTYSWVNLVQKAVDSIWGDDSANNVRNNVYALRERFNIEHTWGTGSHIQKGATAWATAVGAGAANMTIQSSASRNCVADWVRTSAGLYVITWTTTQSLPYHAQIAIMSGTTLHHAVIHSQTASTTTIQIFDAADPPAVHDLADGEFCFVALFQS